MHFHSSTSVPGASRGEEGRSPHLSPSSAGGVAPVDVEAAMVSVDCARGSATSRD
jgi:hypothetical protein